jgi:hypothetical protein
MPDGQRHVVGVADPLAETCYFGVSACSPEVPPTPRRNVPVSLSRPGGSSREQNPPRDAGTSRSAIPPWPMASSTGSCTTPIGSRCGGIRYARIGGSRGNDYLDCHFFRSL